MIKSDKVRARWKRDSVKLGQFQTLEVNPGELYEGEVYPDEYYEVDDQGRYHGDASVGALRARHALASQTCAAFGKRPRDWIRRDLLLKGAAQDPRNWLIRNVLHSRADFLSSSDVEVPCDYEESYRLARAFDYSHRMQLAKFIPEFGPPHSHAISAAIAAFECPTALYMIKKAKAKVSSLRRRGGVCKLAWICPHCYARRCSAAVKLALTSAIKSNTRFMLLLVDSVRIPNEGVRLSQPKSVGLVGLAVRERLQDLAQQFGGTGGMWTQQVCPITTWNSGSGDNFQTGYDYGLELRIGLMASIPATIDSMKKLQQNSSRLEHGGPTFDSFLTPFDPSDSTKQRAQLRRIMIGRSKKCPVNNYRTPFIAGLFYWPPISLLDRETWLDRHRLTANQVMYRRWGDWSKQQNSLELPTTLAKDPKPVIRLNRQSEVHAAINKLCAGMSELPGRQRLRRQLNERGFSVSEREVRRIISERRTCRQLRSK